MKKYILLILLSVSVFLVLSFAAISTNSDFKNFITKFINSEKTFNNQQNSANKNDGKREFTIIGVGDIMLGSNYPSQDLLPKNDANILQNTQDILHNADITVGNLEGTLFDTGGKPKSCGNPSVCYVFRSPSRYGKYFKEAGFDYLSIANNHSNDFGETGIRETMKNLDSLGIKYAGIKGIAESAVLEKDGKKFGFVSFAPNLVTVKLSDYSYVKKTFN